MSRVQWTVHLPSLPLDHVACTWESEYTIQPTPLRISSSVPLSRVVLRAQDTEHVIYTQADGVHVLPHPILSHVQECAAQWASADVLRSHQGTIPLRLPNVPVGTVCALHIEYALPVFEWGVDAPCSKIGLYRTDTTLSSLPNECLLPFLDDHPIYASLHTRIVSPLPFAASAGICKDAPDRADFLFVCETLLHVRTVGLFASSISYPIHEEFRYPSTHLPPTIPLECTWTDKTTYSLTPTTFIFVPEQVMHGYEVYQLFHSFVLLSYAYFVPLATFDASQSQNHERTIQFIRATIWGYIYPTRVAAQDDAWLVVGMCEQLVWEACADSPHIQDQLSIQRRHAILSYASSFPLILSTPTLEDFPVSHLLCEWHERIQDVSGNDAYGNAWVAYIASLFYVLSAAHAPKSTTWMHRVFQLVLSHPNLAFIESEFFSMLKSVSDNGFPELSTTWIHQSVPRLWGLSPIVPLNILRGNGCISYDDTTRQVTIQFVQSGPHVLQGPLCFRIHEIGCEPWIHTVQMANREHTWMFTCRTPKRKGKGGRANRKEEKRTRDWMNIQNLDNQQLFQMTSSKQTRRFWKLVHPVQCVCVDPDRKWVSQIEWDTPMEYGWEILHQDMYVSDVERQQVVLERVYAHAKETNDAKMEWISYGIGILADASRPEAIRIYMASWLVRMHVLCVQNHALSYIVMDLLQRVYFTCFPASAPFHASSTELRIACIQAMVACMKQSDSRYHETFTDWVHDHIEEMECVSIEHEASTRLFHILLWKESLAWEPLETRSAESKTRILDRLHTFLRIDAEPANRWNRRVMCEALSLLHSVQHAPFVFQARNVHVRFLQCVQMHANDSPDELWKHIEKYAKYESDAFTCRLLDTWKNRFVSSEPIHRAMLRRIAFQPKEIRVRSRFTRDLFLFLWNHSHISELHSSSVFSSWMEEEWSLQDSTRKKQRV